MDDEKLTNCWVLVTDCVKEGLTASIESQPETKNVQQMCDVIGLESWEDEGSTVVRVGENTKLEQAVSPSKQIVKIKKPPSLLKVNKRREQGTSSTASANFARDHLLQKYGSSLLRKPSFSVKTDQTLSKAKFTECSNLKLGTECTIGGDKESVDEHKFLKDNSLFHKSVASATFAKRKASTEDLTYQTHYKRGIFGKIISPSKRGIDSKDCSPEKDFKSMSCPSDAISRPLDSNSPDIRAEVNEGSSQCYIDSDMPQDEVVEDANRCYTNPSCPMPGVGLIVDVGLGRQLQILQAKCVLTCLDDCKTSISPQYAEFCCSVVKSASKPTTKSLLIPVKDKQIVDLMRIKWNSKSSVRKFAVPRVSSKAQQSFVEGGDDSDEEYNKYPVNIPPLTFNEVSHSAPNIAVDPEPDSTQSKQRARRKRKQNFDLLRCNEDDVCILTEEGTSKLSVNSGSSEVTPTAQFSNKRTKLTLLGVHKDKSSIPEKESYLLESELLDNGIKKTVNVNISKEYPQPSYDPDDTRGSESPKQFSSAPAVEVYRNKSSQVVHELRRLNVALFDMTNCNEPIVCKFPDICRLGCVCSSLTAQVVRDNCGLEKCMFECVCTKPQTSRRESYTWVQNKARENLAKEERHFKQAVVLSGNDDLILVEGKRKRNIKLPQRYLSDFVSDHEFQLRRQLGFKDVNDKQPQGPQKNRGMRSVLKNSGNSVVQDLQDSGDLNRVNAGKDSFVKQSTPIKQECDDQFTETCSQVSVNFDTGVSARTVSYDIFKDGKYCEKRRMLLNGSSCEKIELMNELKIVSTKTLNPEDWEQEDDMFYSNLDEDSCLFLFDPCFINRKKDEVIWLSGAALQHELKKKLVFLWVKPTHTKPKIFLTRDRVKPHEECVELLSLDKSSNLYQDLPFHIKFLRFNHIVPEAEKTGVWIAKYQKRHWMIVGFLQPKQHNKTFESNHVEILPLFEEDLQYRWWMMDTKQEFDLIYFIDFKKAITKRQLTTVVKLSNEYSDGEKKIHRILLNRRRPKIDPRPTPYPDFGAYSISNHPTEVFIGPYSSFREPRFQVYSQKVAHNGKTEYENIPLFYSGEGEFVKVNSRGVISLWSEALPGKHVKGTWYQSCGKDFRMASDQIQADVDVNNIKCEEEPQVLLTEDLNQTNKGIASSSTQSLSDESSRDNSNADKMTRKTFITKAIKSKGKNTLIKDFNSRATQPVNGSTVFSRLRHSPRLFKRKGLFSVLKKNQNSTRSEGSLTSHADTDARSMNDNCEESDTPLLEMEYLIPNVREIGVLPLTFLPSGTVSVPHFTNPGMLKFFHSKKEVIQDFNMLVHQKLACLSQKCAPMLRKNEVCNCLTWVSTKSKEKFSDLPQFNAQIFNGFYMLTKYGLVDLRSADRDIITRLGRDWAEWLKNDEIRLKLNAWRKEEVEVTEKHYDLMRVLTSHQKSSLSLLQVIVMATNEIARLKAHDQLLDIEDQTQKLMKETLIHSLCRKLNGIPGDIVPQFLEQLDLALLWEVLECMDSFNTDFGPEPRYKETSKAAKVKNLKDSCQGSKMKERKVSQGEQTGVNQSLPIPEFKASEAMKPLPKTAKETLPSIAKGGLVCQLSPFSHLNVSVEEKGIKCASLGAPPLASPKEVTGKSPIKKKEVPLSPGKPPNILRKTKSSQHLLAESTRSQESIVRKHAQKQKISGITGDNRAPASEKGIKFCKTSDRYLYVHKVSDDCPMGNAELITSPNTPDSSSFASKAQLNKGDAIPSLQVSSVISDLPWNDDSAVFPTSLLVKNENSKLRPTMCAPNVPAPAISNLESQSDPVSSLKISSVYSAKAMSPLFCDSSASKSDSSMSSSSELRASLSVSSETLGKITPVLCCSDGNTSSTILTSNVSSVDGSLKENIGALENLLVTQPPEKPLRRFVLPEYVFMKSTDKLSSKSTLVNLESAKPLSSPAVNPTTTIKVLNMTGSGGYTFSVPISSMKLLQSPASNKTQAPVAIGKAIPVHLARSNSSNDLTKVDCNETKADHEPPS